MTIVERLNTVAALIEQAREELGGGSPSAAREFSIAITAVEDATMRVNRGFAKAKGTFKISDVETL